jgi:hypothetical protein
VTDQRRVIKLKCHGLHRPRRRRNIDRGTDLLEKRGVVEKYRFTPQLIALEMPEYGVASFGIIATSLITLAALIGVALLATRIFKTRVAGIMIGIHATLAVGGFVILAAYVLLG